MQILRTIITPWAPYSVMFSRDGRRLVIVGQRAALTRGKPH